MSEQTLNIPQLVVFVVVSVLAIRWYLKAPAGGASAPPVSQQQQRVATATPAQIDQIADMFPQLDRRQIAWDLQRNGGNVNATTERVLTGRGLDVPPASFNPPPPVRATPVLRTPATSVKPPQQDLITRYNLSSKLSAPTTPEAASPEPQPKQKAWSADRNERQANLQRRREEMILAARKKMEEKAKAKASGVSS